MSSPSVGDTVCVENGVLVGQEGLVTRLYQGPERLMAEVEMPGYEGPFCAPVPNLGVVKKGYPTNFKVRRFMRYGRPL